MTRCTRSETSLIVRREALQSARESVKETSKKSTSIPGEDQTAVPAQISFERTLADQNQDH